MPIDERAEPQDVPAPSLADRVGAECPLLQPEGKKTVNIPALTDRALLEDLRAVVKDGFRITNANIEIVSSDLGVVKERVAILETERARLSGGVRGLSGADLTHEAQLGQERAAREDLAKQVAALATTNATQLAILGRLDKVASNPLVKTLGAMLLTALVTWLATHGVVVPK